MAAMLFAIAIVIPMGIISAVLSEDYIRTARAKGIKEHLVVLKHALNSSLIPLVTVLGL